MTAVLEVLVWWAALTGVWLVLISTVDPLELLVGTASALAAAVLARAGRRAVTDR
ncbi:hypothetical protein [Streptomyces sp. PRh5]|uniref:hypothetical protein n=1 Tax=Streptomyces sp. PRh5 TaxID=1158056 RepID=UPI0018E3D301|nr:hypothetical protein [Streptomyces sp. PRh5]